MSRKALYDLDQVLNRSAQVFLEHGFHGTAMDELIARSGFNRRGFYLEFGSKQNFTYRVVQHYQQTTLNPLIERMDCHQGLVAIEQFFTAYIECIAGRGCLLINSIAELGADDETIRELGRHYLDSLQIAFIGCLERARQHREINTGVDIEASALQLTSFVQGFAINAIIAENAEELKIAARSILQSATSAAT